MLADLAKKITDDLNKVSRSVKGGIESDFVDVAYTEAQKLEPVIRKLKSALYILANEMNNENFYKKF